MSEAQIPAPWHDGAVRDLTPDQQREYDRLQAEDRSVTRGRRAALGVMFGAEGGAFGAAIAYASGAFWAVGSLVGVAAVALVGLLWRLVPRDRRLRWSARAATPATPQPKPSPPAPRRSYWPE